MIGKYEQVVSSEHYPSHPLRYVERFCLKIGLNYQHVKKAQEKINISEDNVCGYIPSTVACAAIYKCFPNDVNRKQLSVISGVPTSSIKRIVNKLK